MRPDAVQKLLRQIPFESLRIVLTDGTTYDIHHPELILVERSIVKIGAAVAQLPRPLSHRDFVIALIHIVRLEPIEPRRPVAAAAAG
jgi:hypothetical protein